MPEYKAMSIRQPWAAAVAFGGKTVENKAKKTSYRGRLVIHVSGNKSDLKEATKAITKQEVPSHLFAFGAAIGILDLVDVIEMNVALENNRWANGPICWMLANVKVFKKPIPMKGQLGIFNITGADAALIENAIRDARAAEPNVEFASFLKRISPDDHIDRKRRLMMTYLEMSRFDDVKRLADEATKNDPKDGVALAARGWAKFLSTAPVDDDEVLFLELDKSLEDLDRSIDADPEDGIVRLWRAEVYHFRGFTDKRDADIAIGKKIAPNFEWDSQVEIWESYFQEEENEKEDEEIGEDEE